MTEETSEQTFLAPGFRFHPTDEELVSYYLKRKILGKSFMTNAISEIDIYKSEPWDLPDKSRIKSRDLEWYFFTALDKKHGHGSRTNRATDKGYWKTTGKDRTIARRNLGAIGMKKTLVFYMGRAPCGERTNWVMHEYRLVDKDGELQKAGINKDAYVLCRIFEKSGSGPKNGEKYGAPFVEEEWDKPVLIPKEEIQCDGLYEDAECGHISFPEQVERGYNTLSEAMEGAYNVLHEGSPVVRVSKEFLEMDPPSSVLAENKCIKGIESSNGCDDNIDGLTQLIVGLHDKSNDSKELDFLDPFDNEIFLDCKYEQTDFIQLSQSLPQPENGHYVELNDFINSKPFDSYSKTWQHQEINNSASHFQPNENGSILVQNDLQDTFEGEPSGFELLDEMLSYFDSTNETLHYGATDSSKQSDINVPNLQLPNLDEKLPGGKLQASQANLSKGASSSRSIHEAAEMPTSIDHDKTLGKSFVVKLHNVLESIHAPQAYAAQYPAKPTKAIEHSHSATPINITTQMIRIGGLTITSTKPSLPKAMNMGFYSYVMPGDGGSFPSIFIWFLWPSGFFLSFLWILILAISFKLASYIYIR